jgi:hypothetical protein
LQNQGKSWLAMEAAEDGERFLVNMMLGGETEDVERTKAEGVDYYLLAEVKQQQYNFLKLIKSSQNREEIGHQ